MFDIKEKIEDLVKEITSNKQLQKKFMDDPVSVVEELLGVDLPNDQLDKIVDGVKAKIAIDDIGSALNSIGGLFGKK